MAGSKRSQDSRIQGLIVRVGFVAESQDSEPGFHYTQKPQKTLNPGLRLQQDPDLTQLLPLPRDHLVIACS